MGGGSVVCVSDHCHHFFVLFSSSSYWSVVFFSMHQPITNNACICSGCGWGCVRGRENVCVSVCVMKWTSLWNLCSGLLWDGASYIIYYYSDSLFLCLLFLSICTEFWLSAPPPPPHLKKKNTSSANTMLCTRESMLWIYLYTQWFTLLLFPCILPGSLYKTEGEKTWWAYLHVAQECFICHLNRFAKCLQMSFLFQLMGEEPDLDPDITRDFFERNILQLDASLLTENGIKSVPSCLFLILYITPGCLL